MERLARSRDCNGDLLVRSMLEMRLEVFSILTELYPSLNIPQFGHKPLDIVMLLREVCRNGGYRHVKEKKMWQKCGYVLYLPRSCTAMSVGLRNHYTRLLLPFEEEMSTWLELNADTEQAGDAKHQRKNSDTRRFKSENEKKIREDISRFERSNEANQKDAQLKQDSMLAYSLSESLNQNKKRHRERPLYSRKNGSDVQPIDFALFFEDVADQEVGAVAAGFNARAMLPEELLAFPEYGYECTVEKRTVFLDTRNHILLKWVQNPRRELLLQEHIIDPLRNRYDLSSPRTQEILDLQLVAKVFHFLETVGAINAGVFERASSDHRALRWLPGRISSDKGVKQRHFIIIGAGFGGLSTASSLKHFGHKVTIVEARGRVGGRVFSDRSFGGSKNDEAVPVDLGAMLITGGVAHPCNLLCSQMKQPRHQVNPACPLYFSDGRESTVVPKELDERVERIFMTVSEAAASSKQAMLSSDCPGCVDVDIKKEPRTDITTNGMTMKSTDGLSRDISLQAACDYQLRQQCGERGFHRYSDNSCDDAAVFNWHMANLEYACASSLCNVSNTHFDQDDEYAFQGPHFLLPNGFQTLVEGMADEIGLENIRFDHSVVNIDYSNAKDEKSGVRIQCNHADGESTVIEGDAVIVTVPLGVLQADSIEFQPPLPDWKVESIKRLGFGNLNKVALEFPSVFWDKGMDVFGRIVSGNDDISTRLDLGGDRGRNYFELKDRRGEFFTFWALNRCFENEKPILLFLVAGQSANNIEKNSKEEVVETLMEVIRKMFPDKEVQDPVRATVTTWGKDQYARGAYSYVKIGSTGRDYSLLAENVVNRVYFAGEATSRFHPATTGGAMLSGFREAAKVACFFGRYAQSSDVDCDDIDRMLSNSKAWYGIDEESSLTPNDIFLTDVLLGRTWTQSDVDNEADQIIDAGSPRRKLSQDLENDNLEPPTSRRNRLLKNSRNGAGYRREGASKAAVVEINFRKPPSRIECMDIPDINASCTPSSNAKASVSVKNLQSLFGLRNPIRT